jgi:hypothetical protein
VRWTIAALPSTILVTACPANRADARFSAGYPPLDALAKRSGEQSITYRGSIHRVLLDAPDAAMRALLLPFDRFFEIRAKFAIRMWRSLSNLSPGISPTALSPQRRDRLVVALRALDGRQEGASYREIADALFGRRPISSSSWKSHSLRDRTIRAVKLGTDLMQGNYRMLLLHPYRRRIPANLMRGGDLAAH